MEENKRNNILDNLEDNTKSLYEILGVIGEIKSRINGSIPLAQKCKESVGPEPQRNNLQGSVGKQSGIIADILEEVKILYELV
jgi:hypothetical protein